MAVPASMAEQSKSHYNDGRHYSPRSTNPCKTSVIPNTVLKAKVPSERLYIGNVIASSNGLPELPFGEESPKEESAFYGGVEVDDKASHLGVVSVSPNAEDQPVEGPTTNEAVHCVSEQCEIYSEDERRPESPFNSVSDCNSDKVPGVYRESDGRVPYLTNFDTVAFTDESPQEGSEENYSLEGSLPNPAVYSEDGQNEENGPSLDDNDEIIPLSTPTLEVASGEGEPCKPSESQNMQSETEDPKVVETQSIEDKENEEPLSHTAQELKKPELEDREVFSSTGTQTFPEAKPEEEPQGSHAEKKQSLGAVVSLECEIVDNAAWHSENGPNNLNGPSLDDDKCPLDDEISLSSTTSTPTSEVTSSEPELSDPASESVTSQNCQSQAEDVMVMEKKRSENNFTNNHLEDEEPVAQTAQESKKTELEEKKVLFSSTGTQTFSNPEEELQGSHPEKEQSVDALISLEQGRVSSAGTEGKEVSQFPLFYKPELFMHGKQPILLLKPVLGASLNAMSMEFENQKNIPVADDNQVKGILPIILPFASPSIDKATRESIFHQLKIGSTASGTELNTRDEAGFRKVSLSPIQKLPMSDLADSSPLISKDDTPSDNKGGMTDKPAEQDESSSAVESLESSVEVVEDLPEWIPASELEKAFSAAEQEIALSGSDLSSISLDQPVTFPTMTLPSTNPFAQDLAVRDQEQAARTFASKKDTAPDISDHCSLFKPLCSPKLSPGARPKENRTEPGNNTGNPFHPGTNPFAPDLTPKKQGRRLEQVPVLATEVVVSPDIHAETTKEPYMSHRRQLSDTSMVTLIETPTANLVLSSGGVEQQPETAPMPLEVHEHSKTQPRGKDTGTTKPKKELVRITVLEVLNTNYYIS